MAQINYFLKTAQGTQQANVFDLNAFKQRVQQQFSIFIEGARATEQDLTNAMKVVEAQGYCLSSFINPNNSADGNGEYREIGTMEALEQFKADAIKANCHRISFKLLYRPAK